MTHCKKNFKNRTWEAAHLMMVSKYLPVMVLTSKFSPKTPGVLFVGLAYYQGKDMVFRFYIEFSGLRDFGP